MTAAPPLDFRNVNTLWGSVLAETLVRLGLKHAVISPGSRSTPLTVALARHSSLETIAVLADELTRDGDRERCRWQFDQHRTRVHTLSLRRAGKLWATIGV